MLCIKNGTIHDAVHREAYVADILVEDGKICRIGENLEAEETIDASGLNVYPGFVDASVWTATVSRASITMR